MVISLLSSCFFSPKASLYAFFQPILCGKNSFHTLLFFHNTQQIFTVCFTRSFCWLLFEKKYHNLCSHGVNIERTSKALSHSQAMGGKSLSTLLQHFLPMIFRTLSCVIERHDNTWFAVHWTAVSISSKKNLSNSSKIAINGGITQILSSPTTAKDYTDYILFFEVQFVCFYRNLCFIRRRLTTNSSLMSSLLPV